MNTTQDSVVLIDSSVPYTIGESKGTFTIVPKILRHNRRTTEEEAYGNVSRIDLTHRVCCARNLVHYTSFRSKFGQCWIVIWSKVQGAHPAAGLACGPDGRAKWFAAPAIPDKEGWLHPEWRRVRPPRQRAHPCAAKYRTPARADAYGPVASPFAFAPNNTLVNPKWKSLGERSILVLSAGQFSRS